MPYSCSLAAPLRSRPTFNRHNRFKQHAVACSGTLCLLKAKVVKPLLLRYFGTMFPHNNTRLRRGGIYIAVLGTAMIVAVLGMSALIGQRLQNRMIMTSGDVRQAQLNANTAIELGLLMMKNDTSWRTNNASGNWFVNRGTNAGTCTLNVTDPIDGNLSNNPDDPVVLLGIGYSGEAIQRATVTIDPRKNPLSCLRYAVTTGGAITLQNDILRTGGVISAEHDLRDVRPGVWQRRSNFGHGFDLQRC